MAHRETGAETLPAKFTKTQQIASKLSKKFSPGDTPDLLRLRSLSPDHQGGPGKGTGKKERKGMGAEAEAKGIERTEMESKDEGITSRTCERSGRKTECDGAVW